MKKMVRTAKRFWPVFLVLALLILGAALYLCGYRFGPGFSLVRNGTFVVTNLPDGATVFADSIREAKVTDGTATLKLSPGTHTVVADVPGFEPWTELFEVEEASVTTLRPFMVPLSPESIELSGAVRQEANAAIWKYQFPTAKDPLVAAGGCVGIRVNGSQIIAEPVEAAGCVPPAYLCEHEFCSPTIVYNAAEQLRAVLPYPGRDDALIVATGGLLYVLEIDPRQPQYMAPLFRASYVFANSWSDTSVVVSDGTKVFEVSLPQ